MGIGFAFYGAVCNREKAFNILKKMADKSGLSCGICSNSVWVSFCRNGVLNFNYEDNCLSCDCQTNVAGPGFHKAAIEFTEEFLRKAKLSTSIEDEAEYLEHRDFYRMRSEHFDYWLGNIVRIIKENMIDSNEYQNMMISWDVDQYTPRSIDGSVVMGTGRFSAAKLMERIEREGIEPFARDFFIWYELESDAYFYRNSSLSRLWQDCYFRPSARSDRDKSVNEYIRTHLEKAAELSSEIPLPLKEYKLLCEFDGITARQLQNSELETDYPIGFRREMVTETIGNLKITLPGSYLSDTENNLVYYDNEENWHSVVITALHAKNPPEFAPQVFANVQSCVEDFPVGDGRGRMAYAGQQEDGCYQVIAQILSGMQVTFMTVSFGKEGEKEWAFEFLRGLKATIKEGNA